MCISCDMDDKWPPFIEFMIWFTTMGLNIANHLGVWFVTKTHVIDITQALYRNATEVNLTSVWNHTMLTTAQPNYTNVVETMNTTFSNSTNQTELVLFKTAEDQWSRLITFRMIFLVFCVVGAALFVFHMVALIPNIIQSCRVKDPLLLKESDNVYFKNVLKVHCTFLVLETIMFDIPIGCVVMEILSLLWEGPLTNEQNMEASKLILGLSLIGLGFIAVYKGMMPLFLWIGNPFCFPCIPLRLLVVLPGGLIALVMTFGPAMGVAKNRLLQFAPAVMQAEIGEMANTFFSIGMIFWGIFGFILLFSGCCWYKCCREGAEADVCSVMC